MAPVTRALLITLVTVPLLSACATDPYTGRPDIGTRIGGGAVAGALVGGLAGAALGGHAIPGAAGGMVAGAAVGAATTAIPRGRRYYRDTRGYCYYVDQSGQAVYDYTVTC
jgi:uncharacterized protein YcfJ